MSCITSSPTPCGTVRGSVEGELQRTGSADGRFPVPREGIADVADEPAEAGVWMRVYRVRCSGRFPRAILWVVNPQLEEYRQQFERIASEAKGLTEGLTEAQFNWRPAADQWSIEECLAHLTAVGQVEVEAVEKAVDEAKAKGITGAGPFEFPAWERFILRETEPPVRHQMPAPKRFRADSRTTDHRGIADISACTAAIRDTDRAGGRPGSAAGESSDTHFATVETEPRRHDCTGGGTRTAAPGSSAAGAGTVALAVDGVPISS